MMSEKNNENKQMILEYLSEDLSSKKTIEEFTPTPDKVQKSVIILNEKILYIKFSMTGITIDNAKALSKISDYIEEKYTVTVLTNGASFYFLKSLYPLISELEQKLRKFCYLANSFLPDDQRQSTIKNLEGMVFSELFDMLFTDEEFSNKVKSTVNDKNRKRFTKDDIIETITSINEDTIWDKLPGNDYVPDLHKSHNSVRIYRNDVMHSHYINYEKYITIKNLYDKINVELSTAINSIIVPESDINFELFNQALVNALVMRDKIIQATNAIADSGVLDYLEQLRTLTNSIDFSNVPFVKLHNTDDTLNNLDQIKDITDSKTENYNGE